MLKELAGVDAHGTAGAEDGLQVGSTAGWLRNRLHLSDRAATSAVRTARALFRGPLSATAQAVCDGELSVATPKSSPRHPPPPRPPHR